MPEETPEVEKRIFPLCVLAAAAKIA